MARRPPRTAGKINKYGMNLPSSMPAWRGGAAITVTPVVDASGPIKIFSTLENRLSSAGVMWFLEKRVSPYMADVIVDRFAYAGDKAVGGPWPPLAAYTERLKRSLGAPSFAPNERSGDMLHHLTHDHAVEAWSLGALLRIPDQSDKEMEKKIRTAQEGESAASNPFGGETPPRPVLAVGEQDEVIIQQMFDSYLWTSLV